MARYIGLGRRITSRSDTARRAASRSHRTSCAGTSGVSFASGAWFLILQRSKRQHPDFQVSAKGSFVWENGTKGQRRTPGGPEMTFCAAASVPVSKLQIWLGPDWNTYHATDNSRRRPRFRNQESCPTTCPSGSASRDHLRIAQHYLQLFGKSRRAPEPSYVPAPPYYYCSFEVRSCLEHTSFDDSKSKPIL